MNILHSIPSIHPRAGGPSRAVQEIGKTSLRAGINVTIACGALPEEKPLIEEISNVLPGIRIVSFPYSFPRRFSRSAALNHWLSDNVHKFDVAHIHAVFSLSSLDTGRIAANSGVPYIVRPAGSLDKFDMEKKSFMKHFLAAPVIKKHIRRAALIHCTSTLEADNLDSLGVKVKTAILPIPMSEGTSAGSRDRFRTSFGFQKEDFVWLFLSRIDYKKGLDLLIPVIARLLKRFPFTRLAVVGEGTGGFEKRVRRMVKDYDLDQKVVFCGFLVGSAKADAFCGADCFVLPSMNENFGVSVVESLNFDLPVLLSKNVGLWKDIVASGAGLACSPIELEETMNRIMSDPSLLDRMRRHAPDAASLFQADKLGPQYLELYRSVVRECS
jgi:glycosyltransferase involved in cell wall biosynthesis